MPLWIKLRLFAPFDSIANPGTKYRTRDGKREMVNESGSEGMSVRKGQFIPMNLNWDDYKKAVKVLKKIPKSKNSDEERFTLESKEEFFRILGRKLDPDVFEFFKTRKEAQKKVEKERPLLRKIPEYKLAKKRERVKTKMDKARFGQRKPTLEEIKAEAKEIGVDA